MVSFMADRSFLLGIVRLDKGIKIIKLLGHFTVGVTPERVAFHDLTNGLFFLKYGIKCL